MLEPAAAAAAACGAALAGPGVGVAAKGRRQCAPLVRPTMHEELAKTERSMTSFAAEILQEFDGG